MEVLLEEMVRRSKAQNSTVATVTTRFTKARRRRIIGHLDTLTGLRRDGADAFDKESEGKAGGDVSGASLVDLGVSNSFTATSPKASKHGDQSPWSVHADSKTSNEATSDIKKRCKTR